MKESFLEDGHVTRDQGADQNDLNVAHAMVIFVGDRGRDTSLQVRRVELTVFKKLFPVLHNKTPFLAGFLGSFLAYSSGASSCLAPPCPPWLRWAVLVKQPAPALQ